MASHFVSLRRGVPGFCDLRTKRPLTPYLCSGGGGTTARKGALTLNVGPAAACQMSA
jgi:hypothetical protein